MRIVIGSDKSGFSLKESIKTYLASIDGVEIVEIGTTDPEEPQPFFKVAPQAAELIAGKKADLGILICGTGMGMSQVANKYKGVLAACVESTYAARMCRAVNNSNILCMGGWVIAPELGIEMTKVFLNTEHTQGLEPWRKEFLKKALEEVRLIEDGVYKQVG